VASASSQAQKAVRIDAGIIFADRDGHVCPPFERLGLATGDDVTSLRSSCECVRPQLVKYVATNGDLLTAVMLQFVEQDEHTGEGSRAIDLAVEIEKELTNGKSHRVTVDLLQALIAV